jgi:outer membrane receptor protein involved in Fe transport
MRVTAWGRVCLLACASLAFSSAAWGQTNGAIRGIVNDPSGAVVPGVTVTATLTGQGAPRSVTSDKDGAFEMPELPVGTYEVSAEAAGFKKFLAKDVVVTIGHVNFITIALAVGGSSDTVTVEANAAQVETTSTQLGAVMTDTSIRELPLNARNAYALLQLQPGVQSQLGADLFYGSDSPGVVSVNGGRGRSNNYMVNGGDGNDLFVNLPAIQPSPDAIEEFRVLTNTFDAEYGRNSGSVVNVVTKSGTNQVHGDFYDFLRNNAFNTRGYFDPPHIVPDYKQNQFGGTIGGPIKKDKMFIFASYEGNQLHRALSPGAILLPTPAQAGGDYSTGPAFNGTVFDSAFATALANRTTGNSGLTCQQAVTQAGGPAIQAGTLFQSIFPNNVIPVPCMDPTAIALYNQYVKPLTPSSGCDVVAGCTITPLALQTLSQNQFTTRFDYHINPAQLFSAYYYFTDFNRTDPFSTFQAAGANLPGFGAIFKTRVQQINVSHTWTINSSSLNELRFNYFRESQGNQNHPVNILPSLHDACVTIPATNCFSDPNNPAAGITTSIPNREGVPEVSVIGGFAFGNNFEGELPQTGNTYQLTDNYTKTMGKHTLKFGGDFRKQYFDQFLYFEINGYFQLFSIQDLCNPNNPDTMTCTAPATNDVGYSSAYPNYFIGTPSSYNQGAAQAENDRTTSLYLFAQDSYKLKPNLTLNYGLRWELNTPFYDTGNRLQTFRPGQMNTKYPCFLSAANAAALGVPQDCNPSTSNPSPSVYPLGLVFPGDPGVPRGLTTTYYKAFGPRLGLAWSPGWSEGWLSKLTGGPGNSSIRMGYGIFYNPIEQLVLEQFSAEPPFGGSVFLSNPNFNTPFLSQSGLPAPNVFQGVIKQTPNTPCFDPAGPKGCVDFSAFRPMLLFGEFQPNLKSQYAEQYNLTIQRQLGKSMVLQIAYVGTQAHHLLASHDLNYGHAETCLGLNAILGAGTCGTFFSDSSFTIPTTLNGQPVVIPNILSTLPAQLVKQAHITCTGLVLPYNAGTGGNCLPAGTVVSSVAPNGINLVGLRQYSSPECQPLNVDPSTGFGVGCPADGVPVFSNIFAQDTIANSNYNGLQISLDRNLSKGLLFQASYTYSKTIDQAASFESPLNPLNFSATRGLSLLDARHRFVFSPYWQLPIPKHDGFTGKVVNGWAVSAIITYQTGFPIRIQTQDDLELMSSFDFQDPNTPQVTGKVNFVNPRAVSNPSHFWFDTSNITDPLVPGTFGNLPNTLCCGPALSNTDISIEKRTSINERWSTEFRAEFYNAWNHTQFRNPDGNFSSAQFGQITQTREDPRVIQFGLKVFF